MRRICETNEIVELDSFIKCVPICSRMSKELCKIEFKTYFEIYDEDDFPQNFAKYKNC